MLNSVIVSVGIAVVLVVVLLLLRGKAAATKPLRGSHVAGVVVAVVLLAAAADYLIVMRQGRPTAGAGNAPEGDMGPGMGTMGGGPGGMGGGTGGGGGMGGGMGGQREPSPKRDLGRFVRKLALFQEQDKDALDAQQVATLLPLLTAMQGAVTMTEDEGKAQLEAARAVLTEAQLAAVDAIELPRPQGGMGGPGMGGGMGAPAGAPPAAPGEGGVPGGGGADRAQAFRERMLAIPYVKQQYDAKVAEDPTLAQDEEKRREFFRATMRELSPFQQGSGKDALAGLIQRLQGGTGPASAAP